MPKNYCVVLIYCIDFVIQLDLSLSFFLWVDVDCFLYAHCWCFVYIPLCMRCGVVFVNQDEMSSVGKADHRQNFLKIFSASILHNLQNESLWYKKGSFKASHIHFAPNLKSINSWSPLCEFECFFFLVSCSFSYNLS